MEHQSISVAIEEGLVVTLVGLGLVFLTLTILFLVFSYVMPVIMNWINREPKKKVVEEVKGPKVANASGEVNAVIAAAIYNYIEEAHDDEDTILTIQKVKKAYSPWSSKIYAVHGSQLNR
ncbi:OadG family protein [Flammeovirga kamogawensis]|uniref:OadG family protein n=1 Tax=Flammeovirga kamogawensis TaxID=373891 RepID=A0ABX8GYC1_9BACT|nr:OadG family protein [Flammeovirga kamogawensis]MBB6460854.1 sodium pump decarboxylase gamma subunit [Flammeovirga kamogawensis]QWG08202.1 OadG family protein [Flammeovirga kamogawensis]TRX70006.1 hypothetical protein EO216_18435 [Flammeovirga kamogawensis]